MECLLRIWPQTCSSKEVLFLNEIEEVPAESQRRQWGGPISHPARKVVIHRLGARSASLHTFFPSPSIALLCEKRDPDCTRVQAPF